MELNTIQMKEVHFIRKNDPNTQEAYILYLYSKE